MVDIGGAYYRRDVQVFQIVDFYGLQYEFLELVEFEESVFRYAEFGEIAEFCIGEQIEHVVGRNPGSIKHAYYRAGAHTCYNVRPQSARFNCFQGSYMGKAPGAAAAEGNT